MSDVVIPDGWQQVKLGDACSIFSGFAFKSASWTTNGTPVIKITNVKRGLLNLESCGYVKPESYPKDTKFWIKPDDVLITLTGDVGDLAFIGEDHVKCLINQRVGCLRTNQENVSQYLFYLLSTGELRDTILSLATGSVQSNVSPKSIESIPILLPPIHEQKAIAHILGTLDDKIDQLRKTNSVLEDMASALFKSWFVDFDPVKAKQENRPTGLPKDLDDLFPDSFEDSALGSIPTGWRVGCVGEVCEFVYGKPLVAGNRKPGPIGVYGSNGLIGWHNESIVPGPVIVVGRKGNPGVVTWVNDDCYPIDTAFYVEPSKDSLDIRFLYLLLKTLNLKDLSAESAVPGLNRNHAYMVKVVLPPRTLVSTFEHLSDSSMNKIHVNTNQIRTLTNLRDTLLPKLISGELRVPDAEQMVAELG